MTERGLLKEDGCQPNKSTYGIAPQRAKGLENHLHEILEAQRARTSPSRIRKFASQISECESRSKRQKRLLQVTQRLPKSDILYWVSEAYRSMEVDEALWRGFLAGHFGRSSTDNPKKAESATKIFCAFGSRPYWTWVRVSCAPHSLRSWLSENRKNLKSLGFGNHRKYESHKPLILYRVILSFRNWVNANGGTPVSAFRTNIHRSPEENFDVAYRSLRRVYRFGRTGAFDLLCLLGNMGILRVRPGSCYLSGSTGPLRGARKLWGRRPPQELSQLADSAARALKIPFDIFEDALCVWQK